MALIKCPDCGKMFSEYAECCPECGCPTEDAKADSIYNVSKKETNNGDSSHTSDERNVSVPKPEHKGEDVPHISEGDSIKESEPKPTYDLVQKTSNVVNDDKEAKETEGVPISTEKETETEGENKADKSDRRTNGFIKYIAFGLIAAVVVVLLVIWLVNPKAPTPLLENSDSLELVKDSAKSEKGTRDEKILERAKYIFKNIPDHREFDSVDKSVFSASFIEVLEKTNAIYKEASEQGDLDGESIFYWYSGQDGDTNDGLVGISVSSSDDRLAYVTVKYRNFEVAEHRMKLIFQDGLWLCDNWDEKKEELLKEIDAYKKSVEGDEVIQNAIRDYLMGNEDAVRFTKRARQSLYESTWPEVQCSVEGDLAFPSDFKDLTVKSVGAGLYKYECICPDHGDRYTDCCTISAYIAHDGVVEIEDVKWDD